MQDNIGNSSRTTGKVAWFNPTKGFGFINNPDHPKGVFVHHTDIDAPGYRTLTEGQTVEYNLVQTTKGPKAERVAVVG